MTTMTTTGNTVYGRQLTNAGFWDWTDAPDRVAGAIRAAARERAIAPGYPMDWFTLRGDLREMARDAADHDAASAFHRAADWLAWHRTARGVL
jgi:hypothetical protein